MITTKFGMGNLLKVMGPRENVMGIRTQAV